MRVETERFRDRGLKSRAIERLLTKEQIQQDLSFRSEFNLKIMIIRLDLARPILIKESNRQTSFNHSSTCERIHRYVAVSTLIKDSALVTRNIMQFSFDIIASSLSNGAYECEMMNHAAKEYLLNYVCFYSLKTSLIVSLKTE